MTMLVSMYIYVFILTIWWTLNNADELDGQWVFFWSLLQVGRRIGNKLAIIYHIIVEYTLTACMWCCHCWVKIQYIKCIPTKFDFASKHVGLTFPWPWIRSIVDNLIRLIKCLLVTQVCFFADTEKFTKYPLSIMYY